MIIHIFGYGSLIATPELPEHVLAKRRVAVQGYARVFNKRSPARGCAIEDAYNAFGDIVPGYQSTRWISSLALGTREAAGHSLVGMLISYAGELEGDVLKATDRREGYDPDKNAATLGYLRERLALPVAQGETVWMYRSNPSGPYHLPDSLSLQTRVKLLINATPRPGTPSATDGRARGFHYVEQVRTVLRDHDVIDPYLESLVGTALRLGGDWSDILHPPRNSEAA